MAMPEKSGSGVDFRLDARAIVFLAIGLAAGIGAGLAVRTWPQWRDAGVPPVFAILVALALVETLANLVLKIPSGQLVTMPVRFAAFALAIGVYHLI